MNTTGGGLSRMQLLAAAADVLVQGGYSDVSQSSDAVEIRLFEDAFGIVAVAVFETWQQLLSDWHLSQGRLVDVIAASLAKREPKAWEGYLVLMTPGLLPPADEPIVSDLRNNTNRVRKIVATGSELTGLQQVRDALLPLLPLALEGIDGSSRGILDMLSGILMQNGISQETAQTVIEAFTHNESIVERLHARRLGR